MIKAINEEIRKAKMKFESEFNENINEMKFFKF